MAPEVLKTVAYSIRGGRPFVVTDDYTIDCQLGSGGFGVVCSGTHRMTKERVAIKQLFLDGRCAPQQKKSTPFGMVFNSSWLA